MVLQGEVAGLQGQTPAWCDSGAEPRGSSAGPPARGGGRGCRPGPSTLKWLCDLGQALHLSGPPLPSISDKSSQPHCSLYRGVGGYAEGTVRFTSRFSGQ